MGLTTRLVLGSAQASKPYMPKVFYCPASDITLEIGVLSKSVIRYGSALIDFRVDGGVSHPALGLVIVCPTIQLPTGEPLPPLPVTLRFARISAVFRHTPPLENLPV